MILRRGAQQLDRRVQLGREVGAGSRIQRDRRRPGGRDEKDAGS
jgi:hypothetical protein